MMNVLFIGDLNTHTRTYQRYRALKDFNLEIEPVSTMPIGNSNINNKLRLFLNRALSKLRYPPDLTSANRKIMDICTQKKFDLVWIEKGNTINPSTLQKIHKLHDQSKIVAFSEDDMFAKHNNSFQYVNSLKFYDIVFTTKSYNSNPDELPSLGARCVRFIDKSYDKYTHRPVDLTDEERLCYGADIGFIGSFEKDRADKLFTLAEAGLQVRIWGNRWEAEQRKSDRFRVEFRQVINEEYIKTICATKINMCFLRKLNRDLQTDRTMEIPACGGFMLAERTDEHCRLFEEGREADFFSTDAEMIEKARYYLENEGVRQAIATSGRRKCKESCYSHHDRWEEILSVIKILPMPGTVS